MKTLEVGITRRSTLGIAIACLLLGLLIGWLCARTMASNTGAPSEAMAHLASGQAETLAPSHENTVDLANLVVPKATGVRLPVVANVARTSGSFVCTAGIDDCRAMPDALAMQDQNMRDALLKRLAQTPDPRDKAELIAKLTPVTLPREDLAPLLAELAMLRTSGDAQLRADSLVQMARWDRSEGLSAQLIDGLADPAPDVVGAAITAVRLSNVRNQETKDALLVLAYDAASGSQVRSAALEALRDFSLERSEYAVFERAHDGN